MSDTPLSTHLADGWELQSYSADAPYGEGMHHCFLLRKGSQSKVLMVRKKTIGKGIVVTELEV